MDKSLSDCNELFIRAKTNPNIIDDDGRPIGENRAHEKCKLNVPMDYRSCPYKGSRKNHANPMNVSALKRMHKNWKAVLAILSEIRSFYCVYKMTDSIDIVDFYIIALTAVNFPIFYERDRFENQTEQLLPSEFADLFKIFIGVLSVIEKMFFDKDYLNKDKIYFHLKKLSVTRKKMNSL